MTKTKANTNINTKAVRLSTEIYNFAQMIARGLSRSTSGQLEYWARLGCAAEDNPDLSIDFIKDILASKGKDRRLAENFKRERTAESNSEVVVSMMPAFKQRYKKLRAKQKTSVNDAIEVIKANPSAGMQEEGSLAGVCIYKFDRMRQQFLLAYEFDPKTRILLILGVHENFYRDLKFRSS